MISLGIFREVKPDGYQVTMTVKDSLTLPKEVFLFRKDINNTAIYINVCSIDDLQNIVKLHLYFILLQLIHNHSTI
jgi:hypothetical protein